MKFFLLLLVVGVALAYTEVEYQVTFTDWMHEHGKVYRAEEFLQRFEAFKFNMDYVRDWNANNDMTRLGLNVMADLTNEEYQQIYLGTRVDASSRLSLDAPHQEIAPLADDVDWRTKGAVTGVKNQGQCGSCWAFSTTGSVEGAYFLKTGQLISVSEQNLVDCSSNYGNQGCNGGLMDNAFRYIIANHGIDTEASYPYTAMNGRCQFSAANVGATITGYKDVPAGSEAALQSAVMQQPVSVAIDASRNSFQLYRSGVYYEPSCSSSNLDHGVLAVGYGTDDATGATYWIVKNSWGTTWGTQGYILMSRNRSNNCGIATMSSYPIA